MAALWGALYGFCKFFLLMFWLITYNLPALFGISLAMAGETAFICLLCGLLQKKIPRFSWMLMPLVTLFFEFLRTTGELGFSYGIVGYSQWRIGLLVQSAWIFGVWGTSFAIMLTGSVFAFYAESVIKASEKKTRFVWKGADCARALVLVACLLILLVVGMVSGLLADRHEKENKMLSVALIQPNSNPWKNGLDAYADELVSLIELTDKALSEHPETQLVVWSETAFVPDLVKHYTQSLDPGRRLLSQRLLRYIDGKSAAFVLGNNHQEKDEDGMHEYNSALFFQAGKNVLPPEPLVYNKMRLVPFTEQIPYPRLLWPLAKAFGSDAHYWSAGKKTTVFTVDGVRFCTPICFEDTFASVIKKMCREGAEVIVNLSNDSWSHSLACQNQHLSMAVFRCAENHVPAVRSTASGQTCIIDARGRVVAELEPFTPGYLCGSLSIR